MYLRAVPWVFSRLLLICIKKAQIDKANWKQMKTKGGLDFLKPWVSGKIIVIWAQALIKFIVRACHVSWHPGVIFLRGSSSLISSSDTVQRRMRVIKPPVSIKVCSHRQKQKHKPQHKTKCCIESQWNLEGTTFLYLHSIFDEAQIRCKLKCEQTTFAISHTRMRWRCRIADIDFFG